MSFQKRRAFGQHFLRDGSVIRDIVARTLELARETSASRILEIGPGHGAISLPLMSEKPGDLAVTFLEKDRKLAAALRDTCRDKLHTEVVEADFLEVTPSEWLRDGNLGVVSNLPYATSTEITARLAEHPTTVRYMVLMYQREVAQRLRAQVGHSREVGRQSLVIQNEWDVSLLCKVSRRAFSPPPKVESEVIVFRPRPTPRIAEAATNPALWSDLVKAAFAHRRKTLSNSLSGHGRWAAALGNSAIDGRKRVEALTWDEWAALFRAGLRGEETKA